ncbi:DUF726 domain-containing protein [Rhodococcus sp. IEGM 1408]|uniref:DUF726 domain-containing protein n=1 Tax=Rhodococcus sp. IEGM 1408 TaxID=3082220 RepID=UPI00295434F1|nr:DUF726 domain-containing protein [Rhodococcus sp. IEGM 1408]MDV8001407.1 DUF726 domain-containing protein [Rhodococcus sp. IEGM 1408]
MPGEAVWFEQGENDSVTVRVRSAKGRKLVLQGLPGDLNPSATGDRQLVDNPAIVHNAWAFGGFHRQMDESADDEVRTALQKKASAHAKVAERLAVLTDELGETTIEGWCSNCYEKSVHRKVKSSSFRTETYLCQACGSATDDCVAPQCKNMAVRSLAKVHVPDMCAEHDHTLPSFERARDSLERLEDLKEFLKFDKPNLARGATFGMVAVLAAGVAFPLALMAAPAMGGAVGVLASQWGAGTALTGAAASNYGLAMLGGGAVATGGLGMAGGTMVIAGVGSALGGALGASVTNAYVRDDKSFDLELFREGKGTPVIIARGFTTEGDIQWWKAVDLVEVTYPDSPIYFLHWGAKELHDVAVMFGAIGGGAMAKAAVAAAAKKAAKKAVTKLNPAAAALVVADVLKNPWHVARVRADKTGAVLADVIARYNGEVILVGHSLGGRVMATAAQAASTSKAAGKIKEVRLAGAAIGRKFDWEAVGAAVDGPVINYHSKQDAVLKKAFTVAEMGSVAAGYAGTGSLVANVWDVDVSDRVPNHDMYWESIAGVWESRLAH